MRRHTVYILGLMIVFTGFVTAQSIPVNIQLALEQTLAEAEKITFLIAFLGGTLSILSPCLLPILPGFFATTFKAKKDVTKMTFIFFLGFALIFVLLGFSASFVGKLFLNSLKDLTTIAGLFLIGFGIMSILGKGFSMFTFKGGRKNDTFGTFLTGTAFAIGWTPCIGPILGGVLTMATLANNPVNSGLLLFTYSVGMFIPLLALALFYDRYDLSKSRLIRGVQYKITILDRTITVHTTNLIAGLLLISMGIIFLIYGNTSVINQYDPFGTRDLYYTLQEKLMPK